MTRRRAGVIASSPVLVGAITTLIVILAVFLAYNANNGLPFVPTYRLSVLVPNANTLVKGNDARIGGVRVGIVEKIEPVQDPDTGKVYAKVDLKLDKTAEPVPKDSTVVVRSRSALGLKYLEINKGTSSEGYAEGSTLPLRVATPEPVEIDEFFNIFDRQTRAASRGNLIAFGNALAGRGPDLNVALGELSLRALMPGRSSANRVALCPRKVLIRGAVRISVSKVGGASEIDSWMYGRATSAKAPKVDSRATNICACASATGATSEALSASARKNRPTPVFGEARLRATGSRRVTRGRSSPRATFRSGPRPASASPKATRLAWEASLVGSSKMLKNSSISTGSGVATRRGRVDPSS